MTRNCRCQNERFNQTTCNNEGKSMALNSWRRFWLCYLACAWLCSVITCTQAQAAQVQAQSENKTLTFCAFANYPQDIQLILAKAYAQLGYQLKFLSLSPEQGILESSSGRTDGETFRTIEGAKNYPDLIRVNVPVGITRLQAYTVRRDIKILAADPVASLAPYTFGILKGHKAIEVLTTGMKNRQIFANQDEAITALGEKKVDLVILSPAVAKAALAKSKYSKAITVLEPPIYVDNLYHFIHKKHQDLVPKLEVVLKEFQSKGVMAR